MSALRPLTVFCAALIATTPAAATRVTDAQVAAAVRGSDDLSMHKDVFIEASKNLVAKGWCSLQDFRIVGGWVRRPAAGRLQHKIYITYCGGSSAQNRLFLDATSGRVYR